MQPPLYRLWIIGLALAAWLLARPFGGIWHDGQYYALQALQHLDPPAFSRDLFFLFGSQDQYSLFSRLHAAAISIWGLNPGTMVLQGIGLGLWFAAAWAVTRVLPGAPAALALLLIASLGGHYGSHGLFSYGEAFLTGRLYAEAFSLAGLAAWLAGRRAVGGGAFAAAFAMHPLMALPAFMIGLGVLLRPAAWVGLTGAGAVLVLALGVAGVPPFTGLVQPMDAVWFDLAVARSPFVFLHAWGWEGYSRAIFVTVVAAAAWRTLPAGPLRRLAGAAAACVLGAFAMAWLGGSLLRLPLIAGLQLTRVVWIGLVIASILVPAMLWEHRRGPYWDRFLVWGLALAVFLDAGTQGGFALLVFGMHWLARRHLPDYRPPVWAWLALGAVPLQVMLWEALGMRMEMAQAEGLAGQSTWRGWFSSPATALAAAAGAYWLLGRDRLPRFVEAAGAALVAGLLAFALVTWRELPPGRDYGSPQHRAAIAPVAARVPVGAVVYWVEAPEKAWFWLGRANYLSFRQTAGAVFSRGTAIEALRRAAYVRPASARDSSLGWEAHHAARPAGIVPGAAVRQACRDPVLDFVIAKARPGEGAPYFREPGTGQGYGLHDCRALRAPSATVSIISAVDAHNRVEGYSATP